MTKQEAIQAVEGAEMLLNDEVESGISHDGCESEVSQTLQDLANVRVQLEAEEPFLPKLDGHGNEVA